MTSPSLEDLHTSIQIFVEEQEKKNNSKDEIIGKLESENARLENEIIAKPETVESFDDLPLHEDLLRGIYSYGLEKPSAVQQRAIQPIVSGKDVIIQAEDGSGKATAVVIAALQRIDYSSLGKPQVLIITTYREMALQIDKTTLALGDYLKVRCHVCIGGTLVRDDKDRLENGQLHLVVGTPGRVGDMIRKGFLKMDNLKLFVLDSFDLLSSRAAFKEQVNGILSCLRRNLPVVISAPTMAPDMLDCILKFMRDPVLVKTDTLPLEGVRQFYIAIEKEEWKLGIDILTEF